MSLPILHHCAGARSFRCLWAAEEAGFPIDLRMLPFPPRVFAPAFKDVNPLGTIPAWEENGHIITESGAICERIAHGTPLAVTPEEADWLPYLNWLHRSDATLTFPQTIVLRYTRLEPKERRLPQAAEDYLGFFLGRAKSIERALADGREFLVAELVERRLAFGLGRLDQHRAMHDQREIHGHRDDSPRRSSPWRSRAW
jgi:glutathione S-transferase